MDTGTGGKAEPTRARVQPMRIAFIGTVRFSWHCLDEMLGLGANVVLAAWVDPRYASGISDYRPLEDLCRAHGVRQATFRRVSDPPAVAALREARPEVIFVLGLSQLLPADLLSLPPAGCIGSHPALLPANRGRAVIPWSILLHHERGGLTLFYLTEEVDAGDIIAQASWPITPEDTAATLYEKMVAAGRRLIREYLPAVTAGTAPRIPQDHSLANYLPRRTPEDGRIDWTRSAEEVYDLVRATTHPYPGAFTSLDGRKVVCWSARRGGTVTGRPGEVVGAEPGGAVLVACGDGNAVWLERVDAGAGETTPAEAGLVPGLVLGEGRPARSPAERPPGAGRGTAPEPHPSGDAPPENPQEERG